MEILKAFYERYPYPSMEPKSRKALYKLACWLTELVDKKPTEFEKNELVLDVGCGTAEHTCGFALGKAKVIGIDLSESSIERAKKLAKRFKLKNVEFICEDFLKVELPEESFDYIFCTGFLHHLPKEIASEAFAKMVRLLKPNGYIVVGVYNSYGRVPVKIKRFILELLAGNNVERKIELAHKLFYKRMQLNERARIWIADKYANPIERTYSFEDLLKMFEKHGLRFHKSKPEIQKTDGLSLIVTQLKWMTKGISFFSVSAKKLL